MFKSIGAETCFVLGTCGLLLFYLFLIYSCLFRFTIQDYRDARLRRHIEGSLAENTNRTEEAVFVLDPRSLMEVTVEKNKMNKFKLALDKSYSSPQ